MTEDLALFPLNTVLFPGGPLPLRIFEPRYLDMVSECMRNDRPFVVALIEDGAEVGAPAVPHEIGTLARIVDWHQYDDGLLGIVVHGGKRFRIESTWVEPNRLARCRGTPVDSPPPLALPSGYRPLAELVRKLIERTESLYANVATAYEDADWVAMRMAELLPLELDEKQELLELDDALVRLARIDAALRELRDEA